MRPSVAAHDALAGLLAYPRENWAALVEESAACLAVECPEAGALLAPFVAHVRATPQGELEESFTRTFDNTDERALEVGWHVFGENYTRGSFMANMRGKLREVGVEENGELPDHLSHLLPLIARLPERKAADLAAETIAPAVQKVRGALAELRNPWAPVFDALVEVLAAHDPRARDAKPAEAPRSPDPTTCGDEQEGARRA